MPFEAFFRHAAPCEQSALVRFDRARRRFGDACEINLRIDSEDSVKKAILIAVASILASAMLSSCGMIVINYPANDEPSETTSDEQTQGDTSKPYSKVEKDTSKRAKQYLDTIENADHNGGVVKIASTYPALSDVESAPQIISRAVGERNELVSEKLGVELYTESTDSASLFAQLSSSAKSGMYYCDLLVIPQNAVASLAASGLLFNLRSLPKFDLAAPYFNAFSVEAGAAGFESYAVAGEMTCAPYSLWGMFFSVERIAELGLESPYKLVKSGKWTLDAYFALTVESASYNTVVTGNQGGEAVDAFFFGLGGKLMNAGVKKYPTLAIDTDTVDETVALLQRVLGDERARGPEDGGIAVFEESGLFLCDRLDAMNTLADSKVRWGIVPMPKLSESQESYITLASDESLMMAVPSVLLSDERTSQVFRAFSAASAGRIPQAFVDYTQNSLLRDNDSALMLDTILENVRYDFAYTAGVMYPAAANATYNALRGAVFGGSGLAAVVEQLRPSCEADMAATFPMD